MRRLNSATLLTATAVLTVSLSTCADEAISRKPCADGDVDFATEIDGSAAQEPLPSWAVGEFGFHAIDIYNVRIEQSGDAEFAVHGGDYGGCGPLTATAVDGRVVLVGEQDTLEEPHSIIARTEDGDLYIHRPRNPQTCSWHQLESSALCGRDVGSLGGFGSSEPCGWSEGGCIYDDSQNEDAGSD